MNLRYIIVIVFIAMLSMLGLIAIQIYFIQNSFKQQQENFDNIVYQVLSDALNEYEKKANVIFFKNNPVAQKAYSSQEEYSKVEDKLGNITLSYHLRDTSSKFFKLLTSELNIPKERILNMKSEDFEKLKQSYNEFNDMWRNQSKILLFENTCVDEKIFPDTLKSILKFHFTRHNINLKYNLCIIDGLTDAVIYSDFNKLSKELLENCYRSRIFPNSVYNQYAVLFLNFPDKQKYINQQVLPMLLTSFGLIALVFLSFSITIYTIYKQKKLSDMKTDFINNMTHELKTPVATIGLASNMIRNQKIQANKEKLNHYANVIKQENDRLLNNIEKVLQAARLKKSSIKLKISTLDINQIAEEIVNRNQINVEEVKGKLLFYPNAVDSEIEADNIHVSNMINNLIENSIKYRKMDSPLLIKVSTYNKANGIELTVEDNGVGIPSDVLERVFDKFYRVPTGNVHNVKGFGLGLNYVKEMTEAHFGKVSVHSELGKGSIFTIFLPTKFAGKHSDED